MCTVPALYRFKGVRRKGTQLVKARKSSAKTMATGSKKKSVAVRKTASSGGASKSVAEKTATGAKKAGVAKKTASKKTAHVKKTAGRSRAARSTGETARGPASTAAAPRCAAAAKTGDVSIQAPGSVKSRPLSTRQKEGFRKLLLTMRERLSHSIDSLKSESLATKDWVNMEEDGTDIFDQQFTLNIVSSENEMLIQIDEALDRLDSGEYGVCEDCGGRVNKARLKALPFVRTCIDCQSQKEGRSGFRSFDLD